MKMIHKCSACGCEIDGRVYTNVHAQKLCDTCAHECPILTEYKIATSTPHFCEGRYMGESVTTKACTTRYEAVERCLDMIRRMNWSENATVMEDE